MIVVFINGWRYILERELLLGDQLGAQIVEGLRQIGDGLQRGWDFVGGQVVGALRNELLEVSNGGGDLVEIELEQGLVGEPALSEAGLDGTPGLVEEGKEGRGERGRERDLEVPRVLAMANSEAGTSSNVERAIGDEYQVFLSFRGPDTRYGFTDFLYHGLVDAGVHVFRDEDELRVGEVIGGNLLRAINNSMIYIPIFSQTYASSKWCLRELAHIVDNVSKSRGRKSILPIFLDVEPEDVKLKTPRYSDALLEQANKFPDEVNLWRKALAEVDEIKGWNVKRDQSQAGIVKSVVKMVSEKLELKQKLVTEHLVGLDDRVKQLTELLDVHHPDVRLIGIYGMGGIGKTTIAKVVFNELSSHFGKCCSFLENVRESISTKDDILQLQKKLLSDIVDSGYAEGIKDSDQGMEMIGETLGTRKVLVVLDDANKKDHIKKLIGNESLHSGSRIIITTRNRTALDVRRSSGIIIPYAMLKMDDDLALQVFCRHAFGRDFPLSNYQGLSREIVSSTGGLPLALEVIGSALYEKNEAFWKETLDKLKNAPEQEILEKLRISYDDLEEDQKQIFLDIACFFFNESKTDPTYMWKDCKFYPVRGIEVLTSKCLIKIFDNDKLWMHDQLIAMGRRIVYLENPRDLGQQSRLWDAEEALEIIRTKEKMEKIEALEISGSDGSIEITNKEFERLPNLRFLKLNYGTFTGDFAECRSKLRWISWHSPLRDFRADNIYLDRLVVFKLDNVWFTDDSKAWDLIKGARNFKVISLTECHEITTIPDFSKCLSLERLTLARCDDLMRIESIIGKLQSLIELEINECEDLADLPEEVGELVKLERFSLHGCSTLRELPSSLGNLTSLIELDLSNTMIWVLPSSIGNLKSLRILRFQLDFETYAWEDDDLQFPSGISTLINLEELDLSKNMQMKGEIPVEFGELSSLRVLNLESTSICGIPRTINRLHHLQTLNVRNCHKIQELPELPASLTSLHLESDSLHLVPNLSNLTNLVDLLLSSDRLAGSSSLTPGCNLRWIGRLSRLKRLALNLPNVPAPLELASLSHLESLDLSGLDLRPLMQLPSKDWDLRNLSTLKLHGCETEEIALAGLPWLEKFTVRGSSLLRRLSLSSELRKLQEVFVSACGELVEIQVVDLSRSLEYLRICQCECLTEIKGLSYLKNLKTLAIQDCFGLGDVEGLNELESLKSLEVGWCSALTWLLDASCRKLPDDCLLEINSCGDFVSGFEGCMPLKHYREELPSKDWDLRNLSTLKLYGCETEEIALAGLPQLEKFTVEGSSVLQRLSISSECRELDEIQVVGLSRSMQYLSICRCKCLTEIRGLSYLKNLKTLEIRDCSELANIEGLNELESLESLVVGGCTSLTWLIDASCTKIPDDCLLKIYQCGDFVRNSGWRIPLKRYREEILLKTPNKLECPFTIIFHLGVGVKKTSEELKLFGGIKRENENVTPDTVTYKRLIAAVKGFGFRFKRMWYNYKTRYEYGDLFIEIKSDDQVKGMVPLASQRGSIRLYVEGGVDSEYEGEYDDEMMEMSRKEWAMETYASSNEDEAEWYVPNPDEDSDSASAGESEADGTSSIDDFQSEPGNAECFEATGNRRQMRDGRIWHSGNVHEGKAASMENRKGGKDESGEPANQHDAVRSSSLSCGRVEHQESSCEATTEVEEEGDLSSVKRDRTVETDRITTKTGQASGTGRASNPGRDPAERGRGRGIASSSRNSKGLKSGGDAASASGKSQASNSGRSISSISRSSVTLSSGRGRGSISGKGTTLSLGRDTTLILGKGRGSSSRRGTTNMGASSSPGRGVALTSGSSSTLRTGRGRGSISGKGTTVSSGRDATKLGASLRSGTDKGSSSAKTEPQTSSS